MERTRRRLFFVGLAVGRKRNSQIKFIMSRTADKVNAKNTHCCCVYTYHSSQPSPRAHSLDTSNMSRPFFILSWAPRLPIAAVSCVAVLTGGGMRCN